MTGAGTHDWDSTQWRRSLASERRNRRPRFSGTVCRYFAAHPAAHPLLLVLLAHLTACSVADYRDTQYRCETQAECVAGYTCVEHRCTRIKDGGTQPGDVADAACSTTEEKCDGRDNNCNGPIDEPFNVGEPCTSGLGACRREGQLTCSADGERAVCDVEPEVPTDELCGTGIDEDCDGETDEGCDVEGPDSSVVVPDTGQPDVRLDEGIPGVVDAGIEADGNPDARTADVRSLVVDAESPDGPADVQTDAALITRDAEVAEDGGIEPEVLCGGEATSPCNGCPAGTVVPSGWVCVPAGEFIMGSPGPECPGGECIDPRCQRGGCPEPEEGRDADETQRHVRITAPFLMKATEVTQGEWRAVAAGIGLAENPSRFRSCGDDCPVEQVSWFDAVRWMNAKSRNEGLSPCYHVDCEAERCPDEGAWLEECTGYRFPTEAEWEYAARAGTVGAVYNNDEEYHILGLRNAPALDPIAWYGGNCGVEYDGGWDCSGWLERQYPDAQTCGTHPVAGKAANPWGLYDMLGNVWEWTWDRWDAEEGVGRVVRGGGWLYYARSVRAAYRDGGGPSYRYAFIGFRLARSSP